MLTQHIYIQFNFFFMQFKVPVVPVRSGLLKLPKNIKKYENIDITSQIEYLNEEGKVIHEKTKVENRDVALLDAGKYSYYRYKAAPPEENNEDSKNNEQNETQDSKDNTEDYETFIASKYLFFLLDLPSLSNWQIVFAYTEFRSIPLAVRLFFHVPIVLTGLIIFVILLTIEPEISKNRIQKEIDKLPVYRYDQRSIGKHKNCIVCLDDFENDEEIRILGCSHCFHKRCIDTWLISSLKCPMCRKSISDLAETRAYESYQTYYFV
ncbi:hypothetical protein ENBRE01_0101 [Enteropsectra breve]|nr:hypothetical protein ENBRE01_0101 [Enteropsectra breve]